MTDAAQDAAAPVPDHGDLAAAGTAAWIERAFDGDPDRLERFVGILRAAIPPEVSIGLRGSAVAGSSYETGAPFDADGPGTSDLDVVLIGDAALDLWVDEARVAGMNTTPLCDKAPDIAPALEPARREAQRLVGRPVSIQAMRSWFLDLRVAVQGQPYVVLSEGT